MQPMISNETYAEVLNNIGVRHLIAAAEYENDLGELGRLLCHYELDDSIREVIYLAVDRVACRLSTPLGVDEIYV